jgi:DNA (cytosine-5)-methyltransferase 1
MTDKNSIKVLDLFSGAGGLTEAFWKIGAEFAAHVELDPHACNTLRTRASYWALRKQNKLEIYYDYLNKKIDRTTLWAIAGYNKNSEIINKGIGEETYSDISHQIKENMKEENIKEIDILIGGPPCQAYSVIGRSRMGERVKNDERNWLFRYYIRFLKEFKPKIFVFENVPGLKNAGGGHYYRELMLALREEYNVPEPEIHNARDFGVLQNRRGFIILGSRKNLDIDVSDLIERSKPQNIINTKVSDMLDDLPPLEPGHEKNGRRMYQSNPSDYLQKTGIRNEDFDILTWHVTRPHNERDRQIYAEAIKAWQKGKKLKYTDLDPCLQTHKNTTSFLDRFNVVKSDQPYAQTMVAHIAKDGHYYIHPDISQCRSLSVREAARIQSFPDDFYFEGPRTAAFIQIGNAVPPYMAEQIAKKLSNIL